MSYVLNGLTSGKVNFFGDVFQEIQTKEVLVQEIK